ncbi:50S ribosomal protein L4 [uncultured archaeon]|nr:50S ribosomal protein L4 [uncultured archaeon]
MELKILNKESKETGKQKLPIQFEEEIRPDLIKRAVEAIQSHQKQRYGADPRAGKKQAARLSRTRRDYKGAYGKGLGRMPRKTLVRRGEHMIWVGAFAPGTVKGRRAFPPTSEHIIAQKINDKERKKATRSALAATVSKDAVTQRGHKTPANYPFILSTDIESITKTSELVKILETLGLKEELERAEEKKVRAGAGKLRGRRYKKTKGPLLVLSGKCNALKAAKNIPGVDATEVTSINAELLAPGTHAGRLTIFTQAAIQKLDKEKLFI